MSLQFSSIALNYCKAEWERSTAATTAELYPCVLDCDADLPEVDPETGMATFLIGSAYFRLDVEEPLASLDGDEAESDGSDTASDRESAADRDTDDAGTESDSDLDATGAFPYNPLCANKM